MPIKNKHFGKKMVKDLLLHDPEGMLAYCFRCWSFSVLDEKDKKNLEDFVFKHELDNHNGEACMIILKRVVLDSDKLNLIQGLAPNFIDYQIKTTLEEKSL